VSAHRTAGLNANSTIEKLLPVRNNGSVPHTVDLSACKMHKYSNRKTYQKAAEAPVFSLSQEIKTTHPNSLEASSGQCKHNMSMEQSCRVPNGLLLFSIFREHKWFVVNPLLTL